MDCAEDRIVVSYISFDHGWINHLVHIIGNNVVEQSGRSCSYPGWNGYHGNSIVTDNQVNVFVSKA